MKKILRRKRSNHHRRRKNRRIEEKQILLDQSKKISLSFNHTNRIDQRQTRPSQLHLQKGVPTKLDIAKYGTAEKDLQIILLQVDLTGFLDNTK